MLEEKENSSENEMDNTGIDSQKVEVGEKVSAASSEQNPPTESSNISSSIPNNLLSSIRKYLSSKGAIIILVIAIIVSILYYYKAVFVVARINGEFITRYTLVQKLEDTYGKEVLETLVTEKIIEQEIAKSGVVISDEEVNQEVEAIKSSLSEQGQTLEQYLAYQGIDEAGLRKNIKLRLAVEQILSDKITITDEEVDAYISENADTFAEDTDTSSQEVRDLIKDEIKSQKFNTEAQTWLESLEANANTTYFISF